MTTATARYEVTTYSLKAGNGRHIRKATMVTDAETGRIIRFLDRLPKGEAIRQATARFAREAVREQAADAPKDNSGLVEAIRANLVEMATGTTRIIWGHVVTRFSANAFEIDTWGRAYYGIDKAAELLAR